MMFPKPRSRLKGSGIGREEGEPEEEGWGRQGSRKRGKKGEGGARRNGVLLLGGLTPLNRCVDCA